MLQQPIGEKTKECRALAAQARERATTAVSPDERDAFFDMEQRWLRLAESFAIAEEMERFLKAK